MSSFILIYWNVLNYCKRNKLIFRILFLCLFINFSSIICLCSQTGKHENKGIGFWALDYEKECGFEVRDEAYKLLDSIVNKCKFGIINKTDYNYEEAIATLSIIGSIIKEFKIDYDTLKLFSKALINKKMDCKFLTLTYLTIGENLNLPLDFMQAPEHVLIYWKLKDKELYWETTCAESRSREYFIDSFRIEKNLITSFLDLYPISYNKSKFLVYHYLITYFLHCENYENSITYCNKALEFIPNDIYILGYKGFAFLKLEKYNEAIEYLDKALEYDPGFPDALNNKAIILDKLGRQAEARLCFDSATKRKNSYYYKTWFNKGLIARNSGKYEESILYYDKAIELKPDYYLALTNKGVSLTLLGKYEEALIWFGKAIEIQPNEFLPWFNKGLALYNLGKYEEAIKCNNKAIEIEPNNGDIYHNRGVCKYKIDDKKGACSDFTKAKELGSLPAIDALRVLCEQ